jgi:hypothetical protein
MPVAVGMGAIAGWFVPAIVALLSKLVLFLIRLTVVVLKAALVLTLIAGVIYVLVRVAAS